MQTWTTSPEYAMVDLRNVTPPPGACTERIHHDGDPSTPCIQWLAGHDPDVHVDPEGYHQQV